MSHPTLWYTRCPVPTAFGIALRLGHLQDELAAAGIEIKSLVHVPDRKTRESHFTHTLENSFRHGGNTPSIFARANGADTRLIGLSWTEAPHVILTRPESGFRTVADLRGRRLAVRRHVNAVVDFGRALTLRAYEQALGSAGLTLSDVQLVEFPVEYENLNGSRISNEDRDARSQGRDLAAIRANLPQRARSHADVFALVRGEVDAIFLETGASARVANLLGLQALIDTRTLPLRAQRANNAVPQAFTVSGALVQSHPDLVARVLVHSIEAAAWAKANHAEALRFLAAESGNSEAVIEQAYGSEVTQTLAIDLAEGNLEAIAANQRFLLAHGFISQAVDLEAWVDRAPLELARKLVAERASAQAASPVLV
jgi:ABC-type nitrate/sulfonate/bicarbonate transport system substrate-binding protein